jgi:hypothetical protein
LDMPTFPPTLLVRFLCWLANDRRQYHVNVRRHPCSLGIATGELFERLDAMTIVSLEVRLFWRIHLHGAEGVWGFCDVHCCIVKRRDFLRIIRIYFRCCYIRIDKLGLW